MFVTVTTVLEKYAGFWNAVRRKWVLMFVKLLVVFFAGSHLFRVGVGNNSFCTFFHSEECGKKVKPFASGKQNGRCKITRN